jgi:hypothetical protein
VIGFNTGYRNKTGSIFNSGMRKITGIEFNSGYGYVSDERNKTG